MPCEAPVITATFLSLVMLVSFILPGHGYAGACGSGDRLFHLTAVVSQNGFQLSTLAMSDRLFALRLFARVARKGSFSAAGRELNIPQSTASRTIAILERDIGVVLFVRTTRPAERESCAAYCGSVWEQTLPFARSSRGSRSS